MPADDISWTQPIKANGHTFYEVWRQQYEVAGLCPDKVPLVELLSGNWGATGSIIRWAYVEGGKEKQSTEIVECVKPSEKKISFKAFEGARLEQYKSFKYHLHVETSVCNVSKVTWSIEYVKKSESGPDPITDKKFMTELTNEIDEKLQPRLVCN